MQNKKDKKDKKDKNVALLEEEVKASFSNLIEASEERIRQYKGGPFSKIF